MYFVTAFINLRKVEHEIKDLKTVHESRAEAVMSPKRNTTTRNDEEPPSPSVAFHLKRQPRPKRSYCNIFSLKGTSTTSTPSSDVQTDATDRQLTAGDAGRPESDT